MEFRKDTHVYTSDSKNAGVVDRVVLDPTTGEVTDIIVRQGFFTEDKVISIDIIESADSDRVVLKKPASELHDLPPFEEPYYIPTNDLDWHSAGAADVGAPYAESLYLYPPVGAPAAAYGDGLVLTPPTEPYALDEVHRNTPEGTVAVKEGTRVFSSDGNYVGDIEEVFVDEKTNRVTHFLLTKGVLFKEHKLIPRTWTRANGEEEIVLTVPMDVVHALPEYKS